MAASMEFVTLTRPKADMNSKAVLKQRIARLAGDSVHGSASDGADLSVISSFQGDEAEDARRPAAL
jgi:hypothetical protein